MDAVLLARVDALADTQKRIEERVDEQSKIILDLSLAVKDLTKILMEHLEP